MKFCHAPRGRATRGVLPIQPGAALPEGKAKGIGRSRGGSGAGAPVLADESRLDKWPFVRIARCR